MLLTFCLEASMACFRCCNFSLLSSNAAANLALLCTPKPVLPSLHHGVSTLLITSASLKTSLHHWPHVFELPHSQAYAK